MTTLTKEQEQYIEHEVKIRLHDERFKIIERDFDDIKNSIQHLDNKLDSSIKHLDNKFMLMFSLILGSIWIPFILSYLHITK
jgi:hypothetical protein